MTPLYDFEQPDIITIMDTTLNIKDLDIRNIHDVAGRWIAITGAGK